MRLGGVVTGRRISRSWETLDPPVVKDHMAHLKDLESLEKEDLSSDQTHRQNRPHNMGGSYHDNTARCKHYHLDGHKYLR